MSQTTSMTEKGGMKQQDESIKASFVYQVGGRKKTVLIRKERIVVGAVETADLRLGEGSGVAPIHAVIELSFADTVSGCTAKVLDLASPGGVQVNGQKVIHHPLKNGDVIRIGENQVTFEFQKPSAENLIPDQALLLIDQNTVETIFDYRPQIKDTLESVYSWNECILDIEHHAEVNDVTVPPVYMAGNIHNIAMKSGNRWNLNLDSKMTGIIYSNGELKSIQDLKKSGQTVSIGPDDFAKIDTGAVSIYLSQTIAPPLLKKRKVLASDPFMAKTMLGSIALTLALIYGASKMEVQPEPVQVTETVATILYKPELYSKKIVKMQKPKEEVKKAEPEPAQPKKAEIDFSKPKEEQKVAQTKSVQPGKKQAAQSQAKEGEGARAKGAEGSRGAKNAQPSKTKQTAAKRPSPNAGDGRGGTKSEVVDNGNAQMLKGATSKILNLLGGSGEKLGKSGSKLSGFGGFSTEGNGGLALSGSGKGGGGSADTLLGGLGDKGRGGGKVGTGLGAEGTGAGIVGGKTRVTLTVGGGSETVVVGAIDRDAIEAAIRAHRDEFRYCYEREINAGAPNISGKVFTAFVIGSSGKASQLAVASSTVNNSNVDRCVLQVLGRIQFPLPAGGVPVTIKYPFNFANSSN